MRDYRYVKVPRKERTARKRTSVPRAARGSGGSPRAVVGGLLAVALAGALCYGAWSGYRWATRAALFQITGVDFHGVQQVSEEEMRALADLFTGRNIFQVDLTEPARRASANPWVREVRIERNLPNRIGIVFGERTPRAVLQAANGRFLIDRAGVVIVPVRNGEGPGLPVIAVGSWSAVQRAPVEAEGLRPALALLDELAARGGWDLGEATVRADSPEAIAVLYAGHEFRIGAENYPEKLQRLGEIVSDMNRRGIAYTYVDVRPDRQAAVMTKSAGPAASERVPGARKKRGA